MSVLSTRQLPAQDRFSLRFEAVFDGEPSPSDLAGLQTRLGYPPQGYGGPYSPSYTRSGGTVTVVWECGSSCD